MATRFISLPMEETARRIDLGTREGIASAFQASMTQPLSQLCRLVYLAPNTAVPTRTMVLPACIAASKSALMPMDKVSN